MISYERIDCSEGIDFNRTDRSVKCMILHFKDIAFKYQPYVCNSCHSFNVSIQNVRDFFIIKIKNIDYRLYVTNVNKKDSIYIFKISNLSNKGVL